MTTLSRWVLHADMDAFYAAVEQRDDPALRGRPVLVGGRGRGVVLTASYEARPYGVGSGMGMEAALRRCPGAVVIPPRFSRYLAVSRQIMAVFRDYSPVVEPLGLDEAFVDLSGTERLFGSPGEVGARIRRAVREVTGLAVSVGASGTKYVAKVASDYCKPDGLLVVPQEEARAFLAPLPVSRLWGAGPKTTARLHAIGLERIGQLAEADVAWLERELGSMGPHFRQLALASDERRVLSGRRAHSMGSQRTLAADVDADDLEAIALHLRRAADRIGRRLRKKGFLAGGVRVVLKTRSFRTATRQRLLSAPSDEAAALFEAAAGLLGRFDHREPYRLVGLAAFDLCRATPLQLDLFVHRDTRQLRLERAADAIAARFGAGALFRATDLAGPPTAEGPPDLDDLWD